jgi:Uma2 family endonuclease
LPWCRPSAPGTTLPDGGGGRHHVARRADTWYQADLVVTCAPAERGARAITEPQPIVEVLSPSPAALDRGVKLADYRRIATVAQILVVASEDRHVEVWGRTEDQRSRT